MTNYDPFDSSSSMGNIALNIRVIETAMQTVGDGDSSEAIRDRAVQIWCAATAADSIRRASRIRGAMSPEAAAEYLDLVDDDAGIDDVWSGMGAMWDLVVRGHLHPAWYGGTWHFSREGLDAFISERAAIKPTDEQMREFAAKRARIIAESDSEDALIVKNEFRMKAYEDYEQEKSNAKAVQS